MPIVLMVAEKPSIASSISKILSKNKYKRRPGVNKVCSVFEFNSDFNGIKNCQIRFTSVCGHVYSYSFTEQYLKRRSVDPKELFHCPLERVEANPSLKMVKHLRSEAAGANYLVLWLDCDKEGEKICFEVMDAIKSKMKFSFNHPQTVFRAKFSAISERDINFAMNNLVIPDKLQSLCVDARQEADLRIGCAFTRYQTHHFNDKYGNLVSGTISFGPCQTPTLGFCVERFEKIQSFKAEKFANLYLYVRKDLNNPVIQLNWIKRDLNENETFENLINALRLNTHAVISDIKREQKRKYKPNALNTVELLKVASSKFSIGPKNAMQIMEDLYNRRFISYPRTETNHYPPTFPIQETLAAHKNHTGIENYVDDLLRFGFKEPRPGKDAGDHPPITPIQHANESSFEKRDTWLIFDYVVRHFVATVSEHMIYDTTVVTFSVNNDYFTGSGKVIVDYGFTKILPQSSNVAGFNFDSDIEINNQYLIFDVKQKFSFTRAPSYMSESELIALMEKYRIGTDASIPSHINNICVRNYVTVQADRKLVPTKLGIVLVNGYRKIDVDLVDSRTRSEMENRLNLIANGQLSHETVLRETIDIYERKYTNFVNNIHLMDKILEEAYLNQTNAVSESSRFLSRCGKCRSLMKYFENLNQLHCLRCKLVFNIPNGSIEAKSNQYCPFDGFQIVSVKKNQENCLLCPDCYNSADRDESRLFQDETGQTESDEHVAVPSKQECADSIKNAFQLSKCRECNNGFLTLSPQSHESCWMFICEECTLQISCFNRARAVDILDDICDQCESKKICVTWSSEHTLNGCFFCDEQLSTLVMEVSRDPSSTFTSQFESRKRKSSPTIGVAKRGRMARRRTRASNRARSIGGRGRGTITKSNHHSPNNCFRASRSRGRVSRRR